nr:hypothetical transcript [Hymenolepis microstoma]
MFEMLLSHNNPNLPIIVTAGASKYGIDAVISRVFKSGEGRVFGLDSRPLFQLKRTMAISERSPIGHHFRSEKVPQIYSQSALHTTNGP